MRPCDAVTITVTLTVTVTVTNGTTTVSQTVTSVTNSTYADEVDAYLAATFGANFGTGSDTALTLTRPSTALSQPVFAATFDLAAEGFAEGDTLTVTAEAAPFIGAAAYPSDGLIDATWAPQTHTILPAARTYLAFDPAGATTTGTPSTDPAVALADPCNDMRLAVPGLHSANGDTYAGAVLMLPDDSAIELSALGTASNLATGVSGLEVIPAHGIEPSSAGIIRNTSNRDFVQRSRFYGGVHVWRGCQ